LDWIRNIANFVEFGLDPDCESLQNLGSGRIWTELMEKKCGIMVVKTLHFSNFLDLDFAFEKCFGLWMDLE